MTATPAPDVTAALAYLPSPTSWTTPQVTSALATEKEAQRSVCKIPQVLAVDGVTLVDNYPADLSEALLRRVAANLANRTLPLGIQTTVSEFGGSAARVGGQDREVRRLEGPYRKRAVG